jgi:molecular chaperone DnaK
VKAAVIVGCSKYDDADIADLRFAHKDAAHAAHMLQTVAGVNPANILMLRDQSQQSHLPTRTNLLRGLTALGRDLPQPPETLYFFFSGHGFHSPKDDSDYLLLRDSIAALLEENSVSFEFILRVLHNTGAKHIVLFLDACRAVVSGGRSVEPVIPPISVANLSPPGLVSFCSCEPGKRSYESPKIGSGLFTKALCDALGELGQCVTVHEVSCFLEATMPELSRQLGTPPQLAYTRVEPLQLQTLAIASSSYRFERRTVTSVGQEIRRVGQPPVTINVLPDPILAIDFGTSSSAAAVTDLDKVIKYVPSPQDQSLMPSTVTFLENLNYRVGDAPDSSNPDQLARMFRHVKRHLGSDRVFHIDGKDLTAELVASLIIRSLRQTAEEATGQTFRRCMTAYPANFSTRQANALLRAFQLADMDVVRMVGEPNIASVLLAFERPDWHGYCLIVDLGGGTFDAAVVEFGDGITEIWSIAGSNELGGIDYDDAVAALVEELLVAKHPEIEITSHLRAAIWRESQRAKHFLTSHEETILIIEDVPDRHGVTTIEVPLSRNDFRHATRWLNAEVKRVVSAAVEDARPFWPIDLSIDLVLMTGQGSKIFTIGEALQEAGIGGEWVRRYQELAVVQGLAKYAQVLAGQAKDILILDLTHRGIGIRCTAAEDEADDEAPAADPISVPDRNPDLTNPPGQERWRKQPEADAEVQVIIERFTTIPTKRSDIMTFVGGQDELIRLPVVERSKFKDEDIDIGVVEFAAPGQQVELEIIVDIDENSAIVLEVRDLSNKAVFVAQLNQRYRRSYWYSADKILDLILDGWTVYDEPEPMAVGEQADDVYRYADAGRSLSSLAVEPESTRLGKEIAERLRSARDTSRRKYDREADERGAARRLQRLGRLMAAVGRPQEALSSLTDALAMFVRVRQWSEAALTCEQACDLLKNLDAGDRGTYLQAIVVPLRAALPEIEQGAGADMRSREDALERFAAALLHLDAEHEAREMLVAKARQQAVRKRRLDIIDEP